MMRTFAHSPQPTAHSPQPVVVDKVHALSRLEPEGESLERNGIDPTCTPNFRNSGVMRGKLC